MKNKMHLSLLALVGAILLFVFTSLAWFAVSEFVNIDFISGSVGSRDIDYILFESEDGVTYTEISNLEFDISVPGDTMYYRAILTNPSNTDYTVSVMLTGFNITMGDGSAYSGSAPLFEVINIQSTVDSVVFADGTIDALMYGQGIELTDSFLLGSGLSKSVDFNFSLSGTAGNEFQNLGLEIENLVFYFND